MGRTYVYLVTMAVLISVTASASSVNVEHPEQTKSDLIGTLDQVSHSPIRINSNEEFATMASAEGWQGNGTVWAPWVIENYDINGTGYGYCIYIGNTTDYFEVRNCSLHEASGNRATWYWNSGLALYNVVNSLLFNNTILRYFSSISSNYEVDIYLQGASNNAIINNVVMNSCYGIYLSSSSCNNNIIDNTVSSIEYYGIYLDSDCVNNLIANNTVSSNNFGIRLDYSYFNTLVDNNVSNNYRGIYMLCSNINIIANNTLYTNTESGIYLCASDSNNLTQNIMADCGIGFEGNSIYNWNTHNIETSNTVGGKPVYYWKNQTGGTIPIDAGQVILANCTGIVVENQNVDGVDGITLGYSNNCIIANNTALNSGGISFYQSCVNSIINNTGYCISLTFWSSSNTLVNNTVISSGSTGINIFVSFNNTLTGNMISNNNCGIDIWESGSNSIINNTILNNGGGIMLSGSDCAGNNITGNTVLSNGGGIGLGNTGSNTIFHNNIFNNTPQASDSEYYTFWNDSYSSGGNYWSDYAGEDILSGPLQDQPGSDGIGDTPYIIDADSKDYYPLMEPIGSIEDTPPGSFVNTISPYWHYTNPTVTVFAWDTFHYVINTTLWYKYSPDNVSWGNWTVYGLDTVFPWDWIFDFPCSYGYYEFFSIACDNRGNVEPMKSVAETSCLYLNSLLSPSQVDDLNATHWGEAVFLQWTAKPDATSYVVYRSPCLNGTWDWTQIAEVTDLYYNDTAAYSDASDYTWVVHSKNATGENMTKLNSIAYKCCYLLAWSSVIVGGTGNWISLPYGINITANNGEKNNARALRDDITNNVPGVNCTKVSWWDPSYGTRSWAGVGASFSLVSGRAYQVTISGPGLYKMVGWYTPTSYQMDWCSTVSGGNANRISLPYNMHIVSSTLYLGQLTVNDARALRDNITGNCGISCTLVSWWDPTSGTKSWSGIGSSFALVPGRGYRVALTGAGTPWTCPVTLPGP